MAGSTAAAEVALIQTMMDETTKKGVGPKSALALAEAVEKAAGPIAEIIAADPKDGPAAVAAALDYVTTRCRGLVEAEADAEKRRAANAGGSTTPSASGS